MKRPTECGFLGIEHMTFYKYLRSGLLLAFAAFLSTNLALASGGYDHGTPAGRGNLDLDFTLNPGNAFDDGQSYIVWGYGLTEKLDFHGYVSHEADGTNQAYMGLMYNFYSNDWLDLSTAIGFRQREDITDIFLPQLLYTVKLPNEFDIIGSAVSVYNLTDNDNHCGACNNACGTDEACNGTSCECSGTACGGACLTGGAQEVPKSICDSVHGSTCNLNRCCWDGGGCTSGDFDCQNGAC